MLEGFHYNQLWFHQYLKILLSFFKLPFIFIIFTFLKNTLAIENQCVCISICNYSSIFFTLLYFFPITFNHLLVPEEGIFSTSLQCSFTFIVFINIHIAVTF